MAAEKEIIKLRSRLTSIESCCLHFDGKTINFAGLSIEFIVIALSTLAEKFVVGLKGLPFDRSAMATFEAIKECLFGFDLTHKNTIIVSDTAAVNTGAKNGVAKRLTEFLPEQVTFYPCQLHALEQSLKVFVEKIYTGNQNKQSPKLDLNFVTIITKNFNVLKQVYEEKATIFVLTETFAHSRGDYRYLCCGKHINRELIFQQ